jgi:hypothetical protein
MNIFIYPDIFDQFDNGSIAANVELIEDSGLITSSFNSSTDPYENYGLISVTSTPATGQITLDSNPPSVLNYRTRNVDTSEDYGSLRYGLRDPFSIESYGLITSSVDEFESYDLISTPIYSYGTTSKTITYGLDSILYLESPENFGLITENPYIQYGFLTDSVTYTDYGSVADSLPANQYTDYGNNNLLASDEDYGLVQDPYNEYTDYHFIFYSETVYPYGTFGISGSGAESFTPQTATGSGFISASGIKGEAITDFYGIDTVAIDTSLEASIDQGLVASAATETEDCGLIISSADEVDSYGFLYPVITPFGLFRISGSATNIIFKQSFTGSGLVNESGTLKEENTDRYTIDSILPGGSPEDYGSVGVASTSSESYGFITSSIDQTEDYHYIFYPAGETITPYGTLRISGASFDELRIQFLFGGSGSISASGVKGEAITKFYGIDSDSIDADIEFSTSYGLVSDSVDETEDYGLITSTANEVDIYGFLYPRVIPFGLFNVSGSAGERFKPATYRGSGSIDNDGIVKEENTDRYTIDSILPGGSPEDYGSVGSASTSSESYGFITASIDQIEDYHYIFYPAGETITPYGTIQISGASFDELKIQFVFDGSGSISASGIKTEAITKFYGVDSDSIDTNIEFSTSYGLVSDSVDESEDYGLITSVVTDVDSYGFLYPVITPFGLFNISGSAGESFIPTTYIGSGSFEKSGVLEEKNTDRYTIDSILPGSSPEDYGSVGSAATTSESYGLVTAPIDQVEDYHYIFYPAGETITPYGTIQISGASFDELKIQFVFDGSGSISASGIKTEAITKFYGVDSTQIDTNIEFSTSYGLVSDSVTETEDYGLITSTANEVDSYGFLYPVITPFGLFNISGSAGERFKPATYIGSGSIDNTGVLEEKNTDRYTIDSILPGGSPEDYGSVGSAATTSEDYEFIISPLDQAEDYHYIFYPAGETITPYGIIQIFGASFDELKIQFVFDGSGFISASGVKGEAITKFYGVDSDSIDTNIEFSTSYGLVSDSIDETEDYGLITSSVDEVDSYGFLYPRIVPFGLFDISGSASAVFKNGTYVGSGSLTHDGILEEKNTDSYNLGSILPGGSPEDYGTVNTSAISSEDYEFIISPLDQAEDYHYIFYPAGETITPYGTIQISGDAITELGIQFVHEGSGSISASGVGGEAITDFYSIDSIQIDTSLESSIDHGSVTSVATETEDYGLITSTVTDVDIYGFLYPIISPFGLFDISGSARESFKPSFIGSGSLTHDGILEEKNTDSYNLGSILPGGSPEDYGSVGSAATTSEDYEFIISPLDQAEDYHYIFYPAGETITPFGTIQISGNALTELGIQFVHEGSGFIAANGIVGEAITKFYGIDSDSIDTNIEFSTSYGLVSDSVTETENYGLIASIVTDVDSYGFLYSRIVPFGLFDISGSAGERFNPSSYVGSGSLTHDGILEEKNTDSYNLGSILPGGSPEDYGSVGVAATTSESYGLVTASIDQAEDYHYIFYTAGETVYPYGTIRVSGDAITELGIQFIHEGSGTLFAIGGGAEVSGSNPPDQITPIVISGAATDLKNTYSNVGSGSFSSFGGAAEVSGSNPPDQITPIVISGVAAESFVPTSYIGSGFIAANGIVGEAITKFYGVDSIQIDTSLESSIDHGSVTSVATETEDYGLITSTANEVDSYGFLYPVITPFGLFNVSGSARESFKPAFVGSGSIDNDGILEEKNTDSYNLGSILPGDSPEDYGSVGDASTSSESYEFIISPLDQVEDYHYIFYTAGETVYPYGTIQISGDAITELGIQFVHEGSGSIAADGVAGEAITKFYGVDSDSIDTNIEFSTSYGLVSDPVDETEDYGLITSIVTDIDSYGFLNPTIVPFGLFDISGSAGERFNPSSYVGSGSLTHDGILEEKNTDRYTIDSILPGGSPEDYGSVGSGATTSESYGLVTASIDQAEDYHYIFYTAGETVYPYGTIQISGNALTELAIQFIHEGSGSISASGVGGEAITKFYGIHSDSIDTNIEFSTSYGLVSDSVDESEDYGLITSIVTDIDSYGFLYSRIVPFGLFDISGSAKESFKPAPYTGSGSIVEFGVLEEKNTDSYNLESILLGSSPEDYGSVGAAATTSESYGLVTASVDQVEDYHYIFYPAGETVYPFGTLQISGDSGKRQRFAYDGSGTINIIGYALVPQRYEGSGSFSSFGGAAEVSGSNPPDQITPIVISGAATDLKNTFSNVGSGTIVISGDATTEFRGEATYTASGTIEISGTAAESFVPATAIGSGIANIAGTKIEKNTDSYNLESIGDSSESPYEDLGILSDTVNYDDYGSVLDYVAPATYEENGPTLFGSTVLPFGTFNISGAATDLKNTFSNVGSGTGVFSGAATDLKNTYSDVGSGTGVFSGTVAESFIPATEIGSGTLFAIGGGAEVSGSNPPDQVTPIVISGAATDLKNTFSNVGSGTGVFSGSATEEFRGLSIYSGTGTIEISGIVAESFVPTTYIGSGSFSSFGGACRYRS